MLAQKDRGPSTRAALAQDDRRGSFRRVNSPAPRMTGKKTSPKRRTRSLKERLEVRQCKGALRCYGTAAALESSLESSEVGLLAAFLATAPPSSDWPHSAAFQPLLNAAIRSLEKPWSPT